MPRPSGLAVALMAILSPAVAAVDEGHPARAFETVTVAEGIVAFIAPEPRTGIVAGNSVAVIGDDGVLVVDSGHYPTQVRRMIEEIRKLTARPVRVLVNTHWHWDHLMGNALYKEAFPDVTIIAHRFTREMMEERVRKYARTAADGMPGYAKMVRDGLESGTDERGEPLDERGREYQEQLLSDIEAFIPEAQQFEYVPPDQTFEKEVTFYLGKREVRVMNLGRGNTAGDAVVTVPDAKVVITGDVIVNPTPYSFGSYLTEWVDVLRRIETFEPAAIVPGHGPVQRDLAYVQTLIELLESVTAQVKDAVGRRLDLTKTREVVDLSSFRDKLAGADPWRRRAFDDFFIEPAVERAFQEAGFERE